MEQRFQPYTRLAAIVLLILGCLIVLRPFLAAILFAAAIAISSWPLYLRLLHRMRQRRTLAAALMTFSLTLVILVPLALVAWSVADNAASYFDQVRAALDDGGIVLPAWVKQLPLVGEQFDAYLRKLVASREELIALAQRLLEPARKLLLGSSLVLGSGVAQVSLAVFVCFFLYRDGHAIVALVRSGMNKLIGEQGVAVADTVGRTVRGVMYGLLGTALAQAGVAAVGLALAGVPAVALLSITTFVLSLVPVGPPLIWGGAAIWLFNQGHTGWGVFMLLWGFFAISGVDNVVKPILISRGSSLPFILVLLGVMGGVLAFGFVGLFIGPTLLAVALGLLRHWGAAEPDDGAA
ncbi:AI-2E family transporter [Rugamonas apoptosis]|uniref:AI-2E family transporter n=1 Tax=Rugamonas apoptosis TaxID=2758570 RepID=A0A7W2FB57_9BURK|nr:AI-2E family transporter [Rugamonas apoptosis]MBA5688450.1 AI-2E family transporter [Rugamonas apoptosis]